MVKISGTLQYNILATSLAWGEGGGVASCYGAIGIPLVSSHYIECN